MAMWFAIIYLGHYLRRWSERVERESFLRRLEFELFKEFPDVYEIPTYIERGTTYEEIG